MVKIASLLNFPAIEKALENSLMLQLILDMCIELSRNNPKGLNTVYCFLCGYHTGQAELQESVAAGRKQKSHWIAWTAAQWHQNSRSYTQKAIRV